MVWIRRILKVTAIGFGALVALAVVLLLGAWGAANTEAGREWLGARVGEALGTEGQPAEVVGLHGPMPQRVALERLVLRDAEGVWLTLEGVELAWRPAALLSGRLEIAAVRARRVALDRLPPEDAAAPDEPAESFSLPRPPLPIRLDELSVERVELGAAVLGESAVLSVQGQAAAPAAGALQSRLTVRRLDGPGGQVAVQASYRPDTRDLALDAAVDGEAGGLLAGALDLPPDARVNIDLSGRGPLDHWTGRLDAALGPEATVGLDLAVIEARQLTLQGRAEVRTLLPPDAAALLGGAAAIEVDAERAGDAGVALKSARITTPTLDLRLSGRLDGDTGTLEANAEADLRDPAPVNALAAPASLDGVRVRLTAKGPLAEPDIEAEVEAARVGLPDIAVEAARITAALRPQGGLGQGRIEARVSAGKLVGEMTALQGFSGEPVELRLAGRIDLDAQTLSGATVDVEGPDLSLRLAEVEADLASLRGDASFDLRLADLRRVDPVVGLGLAGAGHLTGNLAFGGPESSVRATLNGDLQSLSWGEPFIAALLGGDGTLAAGIALAPDGALSLSDLRIETEAAQVSGKLRFPADFATIDGNFEVALPDAGVLSQAIGTELAGAAGGTARLSGPTEDPTVEASLTLQDAGIAGAPLGVLEVEATARQVASAASGRIDARVSATPVGPAEVGTEFALGAEEFRLDRLTASADGLEISEGRLAVPLAGGALRGEAEIGVLDLAATGRHLALPIAGRGQLTLSLLAGDRGQGLRLDGRLQSLGFDGDTARAKAVDVTVRLDDAFDAPAGDIRLALGDATAGPATLKTATLTAKGGLADADITLQADGDMFGPLSLGAAARVAQAQGALEVTLSRLDASLQGRSFTLARPALLRQGPDLLELRDLEVRAADGTLRLDARTGDGRVDAMAELRALPLELARLVLAEPRLTGTLDGEVSLQGPLDGPSGRMQVTAKGLGIEDADLPPLDARIDGALERGRLSAEGKVTGLSEAPVELTAELPFDLSVEPFAATLRPEAPLSAKLTWQGELAPLMPFVPVSGHELAGRGDVALRLEGTLADPRPRGSLTLSDGAYENLDTGTVLTEMTLRVEGTGQVLRIAEFSARDGGKGRVQAEGDLTLQAAEGPTLDLTLTTRNATLVRRDEIVARADSEMTIAGPLNDLLVAGKITVDRGEARIPDSMPPDIATLDVIEVGGDRIEDEQDSETAPQAASRVRLDIAVAVPNRFFVRGGGLDTEWAGDLQVSGTAARPVITGQLRAVRGQVAFLGKDFVIDRGLVGFDGGQEIDPDVDVVAVHGSGDIDVTVAVTGQAQKPELTLSSVPELPQDEIISRLLFGTNAAELSALQAAQLAAAVAELTAGGTGPGLLDRLRGLVGVDVLRLGSTKEGDPSVTAGKYIGQDVFVGVEQGTDTESGAAKVEVDLTDNISVESQMGATGESEVGIQFKWDY